MWSKGLLLQILDESLPEIGEYNIFHFLFLYSIYFNIYFSGICPIVSTYHERIYNVRTFCFRCGYSNLIMKNTYPFSCNIICTMKSDRKALTNTWKWSEMISIFRISRPLSTGFAFRSSRNPGSTSFIRRFLLSFGY